VCTHARGGQGRVFRPPVECEIPYVHRKINRRFLAVLLSSELGNITRGGAKTPNPKTNKKHRVQPPESKWTLKSTITPPRPSPIFTLLKKTLADKYRSIRTKQMANTSLIITQCAGSVYTYRITMFNGCHHALPKPNFIVSNYALMDYGVSGLPKKFWNVSRGITCFIHYLIMLITNWAIVLLNTPWDKSYLQMIKNK